jgi:hypothetical protein
MSACQRRFFVCQLTPLYLLLYLRLRLTGGEA